MLSSINVKPSELSNAKIVKEVSSPALPLIMLRYEAISDHYTEEPSYIDIKRTMDDEFHSFEQIFRFRFWVPNTKTESWSIFSENREWKSDNNNEDEHMGGLVVRHVIWDQSQDIKTAQSLTHAER